MTKTQFNREVDYHIAIHFWREMLSTGVIGKSDFEKINKLYTEQYTPSFRRVESLKPSFKRSEPSGNKENRA